MKRPGLPPDSAAEIGIPVIYVEIQLNLEVESEEI